MGMIFRNPKRLKTTIDIPFNPEPPNIDLPINPEPPNILIPKDVENEATFPPPAPESDHLECHNVPLAGLNPIDAEISKVWIEIAKDACVDNETIAFLNSPKIKRAAPEPEKCPKCGQPFVIVTTDPHPDPLNYQQCSNYHVIRIIKQKDLDEQNVTGSIPWVPLDTGLVREYPVNLRLVDEKPSRDGGVLCDRCGSELPDLDKLKTFTCSCGAIYSRAPEPEKLIVRGVDKHYKKLVDGTLLLVDEKPDFRITNQQASLGLKSAIANVRTPEPEKCTHPEYARRFEYQGTSFGFRCVICGTFTSIKQTPAPNAPNQPCDGCESKLHGECSGPGDYVCDVFDEEPDTYSIISEEEMGDDQREHEKLVDRHMSDHAQGIDPNDHSSEGD